MHTWQGVAAMGIIERVEMVDFMCHAFLKFNFGPQINFIIGGCSARPVHRNANRDFQTRQATTAVSGQPSTAIPYLIAFAQAVRVPS